MELYHLQSFVAVARQNHLTRAAQELNISQPALSAHIKALEEEVGQALFVRIPTGMQLTAAGSWQSIFRARDCIRALESLPISNRPLSV